MRKIKITAPTKSLDHAISISGSKSISNRVLIIRALAGSTMTIHNLSNSEDTRLLIEAQNNITRDQHDLNHAGTSIRFLCAYYAIQKGTQILTGSDRMKQRPIAPLVEALNEIGANIEYLEEEGYPPVKIHAFQSQTESSVSIKADVSSQFISALCLIAPYLPEGLEINLEEQIVSSSYTNMTLGLMEKFGIQIIRDDRKIQIPNQAYIFKEFTVESDWSSAAYLMAICSMIPGSKIRLQSFFQDSLQGDSEIVNLFRDFGLKSEFEDGILKLQHTESKIDSFSYDFINIPDQFQSFCVLAAAKKMKFTAKGLMTLAHKESDRVNAMNTELNKIGLGLEISSTSDQEVKLKGHCMLNEPEFDTHHDHRMALSLSIFSTLGPVIIKDPQVIEKSFPEFWNVLSELGFQIQKIPT